MPNYIRAFRPGGTFFFTVRLADRNSDLLVRDVGRLRAATRHTLGFYPFRIDAICVLPNTIHTVWTLPPGDSNFSKRWSLLKSTFSRGQPHSPHRTQTQIARSEKGIWQRRFWEHCIRSAEDLRTHVTMIHTSPVQAGLCPRPEDWPYSSIHRARAAQAPKARHPVGHGAVRGRGAAGLHHT